MEENPFDSDSASDMEAQRIRADAIGEPGQRRFRLMVVVDGETTIVWMEKQQLQALGLALEQLLDDLPEPGLPTDVASVPVEFDDETRQQFRAGRMELGYDEKRDRFVVVAHDINEDVEGEVGMPAFGCRMSRDQARELSADAEAIVAAGRPRCPMCGMPMGPEPHVCPQQNGHLPHAIGDTEKEVGGGP